MKKVSTNEYEFTNEEIEEIIRGFNIEVDDFLSDRYEVALPIFAIRLLLETCISDVRNFDALFSQGNAFGASEGLNIRAKRQIVYIIAEELKKHSYDWKEFFFEIMRDIKKREQRP